MLLKCYRNTERTALEHISAEAKSKLKETLNWAGETPLWKVRAVFKKRTIAERAEKLHPARQDGSAERASIKLK